jgi:RHS repeat-associated protein
VSHPSFELDGDAVGIADGWSFGENCAGTPTPSIANDPAPGGAAKAQRIQYSGQAGDQDRYLYLVQQTEVGSFAAGNDATFAISVKGAVPTDTLELWLDCYDANDNYVGSTPNESITPGLLSFNRGSIIRPSLPANTSWVEVGFWVKNIDQGDVIDLTFDCALLEKTVRPRSYFDGSTSGAVWDGPTNASSSTLPATSWRIDYLYDEEESLYGGVYRSPSSSTSAIYFSTLTPERGDVVELLDRNGAAFAAYRYDAWGNPLGAGSYATGIWTQSTALIDVTLAGEIAERQILRYAGYAYDAESGLYYCSARYYDPATRQFTTKDEVKADGEESAYQYCSGDPVGQSDPSGYVYAGYDSRTLFKKVVARDKAAAPQIHKLFKHVIKPALEAASFYIPGGAALKSVKLATKAAKIVKTVKAVVSKAAQAVRQSPPATTKTLGAGQKAVTQVQRHHPWPMYLGGPKKQTLSPLPRSTHEKYHAQLDRVLPRQKSSQYYRSLPPKDQSRTVKKLEEFTKSFDRQNNTKLYRDLRRAKGS